MSEYVIETIVQMTSGSNINPNTTRGVWAIKVMEILCHEVNRAFCASLGDLSQKPYEDAPSWQTNSTAIGVRAFLADVDMTPAQTHAKWLAQKRADGWIFGEVKDPDKKTHPCIVDSYEALPLEQRVKDSLFLATCKASSFLYGSRFAYYEPSEVNAKYGRGWKCTEELFTPSMDIVTGRAVTLIDRVCKALAHAYDYPVPSGEPSRHARRELHMMVDSCAFATSKTPELAYDAYRRAHWPQLFRSFEEMSIAGDLQKKFWYLAFGITKAVLAIEGIKVIPHPRTWTSDKITVDQKTWVYTPQTTEESR